MRNALKVANREVGELPLSIGTSLAIEQLIKTPNEWPEQLWINIRTVIRNIVGALPPEVKNGLVGIDVYPTLSAELNFIKEHVYSETRTKTTVVYYYCDYSDLRIKFPSAILKEAKTPNQLDAIALETTIVQELFAQASVDIKMFRTDIKADYSKIVMISHLPIDLLSAHFFHTVKLLESHTGTFKGKSEWNSKLTGGNKLLRIPFNKFTVQVFGDNNNHFNAMPISIKKIVLELADKKKWTTVSGLELITSHIKDISDLAARDFLLKIIRA
jgi:hypothetical protein